MTEIINHLWGSGLKTPPELEGKFRVIFSDPPYNQAVAYKDDLTGDWRQDEVYQTWVRHALHELSPCLVPGGTLWWLTPERHADVISPMLREEIGPRVYRIIVENTFAQYQQGSLTDDYLFLFVHQKPGPCRGDGQYGGMTFNPDSIREKSKRQEMNDPRADPRGRVPGRVWTIRRLQGTSKDRVPWHPAQLAPELVKRIVRGWSNPGDAVLDAFAGSGSTGLVCHKEKRECVLVDGSPTYCQKMRERLAQEGVPVAQ